MRSILLSADIPRFSPTREFRILDMQIAKGAISRLANSSEGILRDQRYATAVAPLGTETRDRSFNLENSVVPRRRRVARNRALARVIISNERIGTIHGSRGRARIREHRNFDAINV
jgi:hypothetical protein